MSSARIWYETSFGGRPSWEVAQAIKEREPKTRAQEQKKVRDELSKEARMLQMEEIERVEEEKRIATRRQEQGLSEAKPKQSRVRVKRKWADLEDGPGFDRYALPTMRLVTPTSLPF